MALITCSECSKEVSDKAFSCPSCGAPITSPSHEPLKVTLSEKSHTYTTRTGGKWEGIGFLMIVGGMFMIMAGNVTGAFIIILGFIVFLVGRFK
jgi:uncharacterized membrane protein YvbJ